MVAHSNQVPWHWVTLGIVVGLGLAFFWPHEPAFSQAVDRSQQFAIVTCPVVPAFGGVGAMDGIFTFDFLTGDLRGAVINQTTGKFAAFYEHNVMRDFNLSREGKFAITAGSSQFAAKGGVQFGTGSIYVAEQTSGRIFAYNMTVPSPKNPPKIIPMDGFSFRQASEKQ